jgi:hypothetical protein
MPFVSSSSVPCFIVLALAGAARADGPLLQAAVDARRPRC